MTTPGFTEAGILVKVFSATAVPWRTTWQRRDWRERPAWAQPTATPAAPSANKPEEHSQSKKCLFRLDMFESLNYCKNTIKIRTFTQKFHAIRTSSTLSTLVLSQMEPRQPPAADASGAPLAASRLGSPALGRLWLHRRRHRPRPSSTLWKAWLCG